MERTYHKFLRVEMTEPVEELPLGCLQTKPCYGEVGKEERPIWDLGWSSVDYTSSINFESFSKKLKEPSAGAKLYRKGNTI